ncbi:frizzled-3a isoform X1 [Tachysurus ichikawai]
MFLAGFRTMCLAWFVLFMLTTCSAINMQSAGSHSTFTCEPITLRMCQGLSYNTTFMPNLLNHYDQQTAALAMEVLLFLVSGMSHFIHYNGFHRVPEKSELSETLIGASVQLD